jgi:hypothetical protein
MALRTGPGRPGCGGRARRGRAGSPGRATAGTGSRTPRTGRRRGARSRGGTSPSVRSLSPCTSRRRAASAGSLKGRCGRRACGCSSVPPWRVSAPRRARRASVAAGAPFGERTTWHAPPRLELCGDRSPARDDGRGRSQAAGVRRRCGPDATGRVCHGHRPPRRLGRKKPCSCSPAYCAGCDLSLSPQGGA